MGIFALTGLLNSAYVVWIWFKYMHDNFVNSNFWLTWISVVIVNGGLWMPIFVGYPATFSMSTNVLLVTSWLAQATKFGLFGAYWANIGVMVYTLIV